MATELTTQSLIEELDAAIAAAVDQPAAVAACVKAKLSVLEAQHRIEASQGFDDDWDAELILDRMIDEIGIKQMKAIVKDAEARAKERRKLRKP